MTLYLVNKFGIEKIVDFEKIPDRITLTEIISSNIFLEHYNRILLYADDFEKLCDDYSCPTFDGSQSITSICGLSTQTTDNALAKGNVFILAKDALLKSENDLLSIFFRCNLFTPGMPVKTKYNHALFNESEKHKMKIIDERKVNYAKPEDFEDGDIILDEYGDYYKIHFDSYHDNDYCLEDLSDGHIFDSSDNLTYLINTNTRRPLIRIKQENTELHVNVKRDKND